MLARLVSIRCSRIISACLAFSSRSFGSNLSSAASHLPALIFSPVHQFIPPPGRFLHSFPLCSVSLPSGPVGPFSQYHCFPLFNYLFYFLTSFCIFLGFSSKSSPTDRLHLNFLDPSVFLAQHLSEPKLILLISWQRYLGPQSGS